MPEAERLDRIERLAVQLETDLKTVVKSVGDMSEATTKLIEMQTDQKLLKNDMLHSDETLKALIAGNSKAVDLINTRQEGQGNRLTDMEKAMQKNTMATNIASKVGWSVITAIITAVVGVSAYFFKG
jgi:hypothetical protein